MNKYSVWKLENRVLKRNLSHDFYKSWFLQQKTKQYLLFIFRGWTRVNNKRTHVFEAANSWSSCWFKKNPNPNQKKIVSLCCWWLSAVVSMSIESIRRGSKSKWRNSVRFNVDILCIEKLGHYCNHWFPFFLSFFWRCQRRYRARQWNGGERRWPCVRVNCVLSRGVWRTLAMPYGQAHVHARQTCQSSSFHGLTGLMRSDRRTRSPFSLLAFHTHTHSPKRHTHTHS